MNVKLIASSSSSSRVFHWSFSQSKISFSSSTIVYILPLFLSGQTFVILFLSYLSTSFWDFLFYSYYLVGSSSINWVVYHFPSLFNNAIYISFLFFLIFAVTFSIFRTVLFVFLSNLEILSDHLQKIQHPNNTVRLSW